jgi:predicted MFS family arabinose efflux permease
MVDRREDLPNAIALNSSMFNASRIIGPSIGGLLIAVVGEGWCFMADAISYIAVILSLVAMRFNRAPVVRRQSRMLEELRSGVAYTFGFPPVRALLADVAIIGTFGMMYSTLAPVIASRVLHGGAHTLGLLMTASGVGALLGTVYLASRHSVVGLGKVIVTATVALSLGLAAFAFTQHLWLALLVLPVVGAGLMLSAASANTILQTVVTEELRGRVMAFYSVAVLGTQPFGSLLAGILGDRIGTQNTILLSAIVCLFTSVWFGIRRPALAEHIKPIYLELGILESVDPVVVEES